MSRNRMALALVTLLTVSSAQSQSSPPLLTLEDCVQIALNDNPRMAVAKHESAIQLIQLERERPTGLHPNITLSASQTLTAPPVHFPNGAGPLVTPFSRPAFAATFSQTVFHFGARLADKRASSVERAIALDATKTEADVRLDVKKAYFNVLTALQMVAVARDGVQQVEEHIEITKVALEAGTAMPLDLKRAEVELVNLQSGMLKAENGLALAEANLNRTLGRAHDAPVALKPLAGPPADPPALAEAIALALKQRSELAALRETIASLETAVALARTQSLPTAAVKGGMIHQRESAFVRSPSWTAALEISMPLFDHKTQTDLREVRARLAQMRSRLKEAESGIALEVRQAWLNYREAKHRVNTLPKSIEAANDAVRIAELRFGNGRATYLEVTDAMLQSRKGKADQVQAISDLHIAAAELEKATGKRQ